MNSDPVQQPRKAVKKVGRDGARCVFSETYMAGRLLVGADLRAARGEWGASRKPAGSEIRPYQNRTSSGTMSNPALRQSDRCRLWQRNSPAGPETTFALRATACPQTG